VDAVRLSLVTALEKVGICVVVPSIEIIVVYVDEAFQDDSNVCCV